jgi:hypothetical protein
MLDDKQKISAAYWRKRSRSNPIPRDQAIRQGDITSLAFRTLGKDKAIAFLNADNPRLGGRPLAIATKGHAGQQRVEAELGWMRERQPDGSQDAQNVPDDHRLVSAIERPRARSTTPMES